MTRLLFSKKLSFWVLLGILVYCLMLDELRASLSPMMAGLAVLDDFDSTEMKTPNTKNNEKSLTAREQEKDATPANVDKVVSSSRVFFPKMTKAGERTRTTPPVVIPIITTNTKPQTIMKATQNRNKFDQYIDRRTNTLRRNNPNLQKLLSFSILGFAKTATTFLQRDWLPLHPQICLPRKEVCNFNTIVPDSPRDVQTVRALLALDHIQRNQDDDNNNGNSKNVTAKKNIQRKQCLYRGFKCPTQILNPDASVRDLISRWWPKAKLIVGVRHPLLWFQSFYNYRVREGYPMRPAQELIGGSEDFCQASYGVCTEHAKFHIYLARLGKTRLDTPHERSLLQLPAAPVAGKNMKARKNQKLTRSTSRVVAVPNPIFLIESSQIDIDNDTPVNGNLTESLRNDLTQFLELPFDMPLPPIPRRLERNDIPSLATSFSSSSSALGGGGGKQPVLLNICKEPYRALRRELVEIGTNASRWILQYFLKTPGVHVSSRAYLERQLKTWQLDLCENRGKNRNSARP